MKRILYIFICISLILSPGCRKKESEKEGPIDEDRLTEEIPEDFIQEEIEEVDPIKSVIDNMSLDEKLGQLFIVGFNGQEIDKEIVDLIEGDKVSGFILFKRNIGSKDEISQLIEDLKERNETNKIPLFISLDEEGGNVSRLNHIFGGIPAASKIGKMDNVEETFNYGVEIGERLSELGFNLNFAPVLDINTNPKNPVIGNRAFGNTPELVIRHGIEFMKGIEDRGIIACVKHFPGHGDTIMDSHKTLPIVDKNLEELKEMELLPFIKAIEEDVDMIMIAHILLSKIDGDYPSSMSKTIISDLLRGDLNFEGVVITDDLIMGGIRENYKLEEAAVEFFKAGGDIALIGNHREDFTNSIRALRQAIENDEISIEDIDEKLYRILSLKEKYSL